MIDQKIKRVWVEAQVFHHDEPEADVYYDVYYVEKTATTLTIHTHGEDKLWKDIIPMKEISFYRISEEIEYHEEEEDY